MNNIILKRELAHIGIILSNISIFSFIISLILPWSSLLFLLAILAIFIYIFIGICSVGILFFYLPLSKVISFFDNTALVVEFMMKIFPYVVITTLCLSIISFSLTLFDKSCQIERKKRVRSIVIGVISIIMLVIYLLLKGK